MYLSDEWFNSLFNVNILFRGNQPSGKFTEIPGEGGVTSTPRNRGGSRGRVQGGGEVEVEQETSAPPPKKNPGSAPAE